MPDVISKPKYSGDSPEFKLALAYFMTNCGNPFLETPQVVVSDSLSGPLGIIEDIQVVFSAPPVNDCPLFRTVDQNPAGWVYPTTPGSLPPITQRAATCSCGIDLFTVYTNVPLATMSDTGEGYQYFMPPVAASNIMENVLAQLQAVVPAPPVDGNIWIGGKRTNIGQPDAVGDQRHTAPPMPGIGVGNGRIPVGTTSVYNGLVWQLTQYVSGIIATDYWLAIAVL